MGHTCTACGAVVQPAQRFCQECGSRLGAAEDAGERRILTALCCRLVGARLVHDDDPPEDLLRFLEIAATEIDRFGGSVVQRTGRDLVALIGAPVAYEDHARRAVLSAIALQESLAGAATSHADLLRAAIGVSSGEVLVGLGGPGALTAVGAPIEEAHGLAERAEPGAVLIGATTEEAVRGYVSCRPAPAAAQDAAPSFVVTGRGRRVSRLDRADRRVTRFVGRKRQMMALGELLDEVCAGRGQVVGIAADAGMGKSRLVAEFLAGAPAGVRAHEGRCLSYASGTPFVPIADVVRAQIGLSTSTPPEGIRPAIDHRLAALGLEASRHAPYLARLVGSADRDTALADRSPEAVREGTFESVVALLVAEAAEEPTIIVLEDLHWVDADSLALIARLVASLPGRRAMILCTFRPGFQPPWMGSSYATQLTLPPITAHASREVVASIIGDLPVPAPLIDAAVARADGNPFFLEELAYAVAGGALGADGVPATVHDVLLARIDQLEPAQRRLLRTASVLGREFPRALLEAMWTGPEDLDPLIDELRRREFLHEAAGADQTLLFRHALTHDVAYSGLLASRRRELHRAAGEALERVFPDRTDENAARLGDHFSRAGDDARAVHYLAVAAEQALHAYANESAAEALERALAHVARADAPELRRRAPALVFRLAFTLYLLGRFRDALDRLESPLARPAEDEPALRAEHDFWLSYFHTHLGNSEAAHRHARRAIEAAEVLGDRFTAGRAHYVLTREDFWLCRYASGVENGRRAMELLEGSEDWWWWRGHASSWKGLCHLERGEFEEALRHCRRMNAIGTERDDPRLLSYSDWNLGWIEATRGNAELGIQHCARSLQRSPDPLNSAYSTGWLGFCHRERGDFPEAIAHLERSIDALRTFGYSRLVGWFGAWLADAYLWAGRTEDARRTAEESLEVSRAVGYPWAVAVAVRSIGRIAEAGDRLDEAADRMSDARRRFAEIDAGFDAAVTVLDLARVTTRAGDRATARAHAEDAAAAFAAMRAPAYRERAARMLADLEAREGGGPRPRGEAAPASPLRLTSLGRFAVELGGAEIDEGALGGPLARRLLAILLAARAPVHRDRLVEWLWPEGAPADSGTTLAEACAMLDGVLGAGRIVLDGPSHRLALGVHDEWDAQEVLRSATEAIETGAPVDPLADLLDGPEPFSEWPDAEWALPLRVEFSGALNAVRGALAERLLSTGQHDQAHAHFSHLVEHEPANEEWHRGLMRCHAACGETALALRQYHACRSALRQVRGTDPSAATQALYLELLSRS